MQLGSMVFGRVFCPGRQYSRGRVVAYEPNTLTEVTGDGVLRSQQAGPGGRELRIAWTDGIDTTNLSGTTASPDFFRPHATGRKVGTLNDVGRSMIGVSQIIGTGDNPFLYLPAINNSFIDDSAADGIVFVQDKDHILMTATTGVTIESVLGDESVDEVFRVASFSAREVR